MLIFARGLYIFIYIDENICILQRQGKGSHPESSLEEDRALSRVVWHMAAIITSETWP